MSVTVVVPTYEEAANIGALFRRLHAIDCVDQIVVVDDSPTRDTVLAVQHAARRVRHYGKSVEVIHREGDERLDGLSGAVLTGIRHAASDIVVVMDGDLQHPPETIPVMLKALSNDDRRIVIASRYCGSGSHKGLSNGYRVAVSRSSTIVSKLLFPRRLKGVTDPMTGFFALRRSELEFDVLSPRGFKILLEFIVTQRHLAFHEVPFDFGERLAGHSKTDPNVGIEFLKQLFWLRTRRFAQTEPVATVPLAA